MTPRARAAWLAGAVAVAAAGGAVAYRLVQVRQESLPALPTATVPASWREFRKAPGHETHVTQEGIACGECHDLEHGFAPRDMQVCAQCHEPQAHVQHAVRAEHAGQMPLSDCTACHGFGPDAVQRATDCVPCHEQPQGELAAVEVHAREACATCHQPHEDPAVRGMACTGCHPAAQNDHPAVRSGERASAGMGAGAGAAAHGSADNCLTCHDAHERAEGASDRCRDCHDLPHALFAGHAACTSCHEPHGFARAEVEECRGCHRDQHALAAARVPAHGKCTSCHAPHAVAGASDAACRSCHAQVTPDHPAVEGRTCTSCHDPHPPAGQGGSAARLVGAHGGGAHAQATAAACASCHRFAPDDQAAHAGKAACTSCHAPHAFAHPPQSAACDDCHRSELTATAVNAGHARCLDCHEGHPHDSQMNARACTTCHARVHTREEHARCTACHEPHSGMKMAAAVTCNRCHAAEHRSTTQVHRECSTCHTAHEGGMRPEARCEHCHARQAAQNHGTLAPGCGACHGVHAKAGVRAAPACTTCHQPASLPGLHAEPAHRECGKCHQGAHDAGPFSSRATCISCHRKQRDHVPEAQLCQGCHVFAR